MRSGQPKKGTSINLEGAIFSGEYIYTEVTVGIVRRDGSLDDWMRKQVNGIRAFFPFLK